MKESDVYMLPFHTFYNRFQQTSSEIGVILTVRLR